MNELYADIVLPLAQGAFTFRVGERLCDEVAVGQCVMVQLGRSKIYMGIVWRLHGEQPPYKTIKTVDEFVRGAPVLSTLQMRFWEWVAGYYMCTLGEVLRAALPSSLKPEGFSAEEFQKDSYKPRVVSYVGLHPSVDCEQELHARFESLKRAQRQYDALVEFTVAAGGNSEQGMFSGATVARSLLQADSVQLKALVKRNILAVTTRELKAGALPPLPHSLPVLTTEQQRALEQIRSGFEQKDVALLHGVTGSGKTEIYVSLIAETLARGQDVLYLLPEIALTGQLIERMKRWFGERVVTYHSRFAERRRVESYLRVAEGSGGELVMGVRSALFLPIRSLGLVIIDEEHESSFKQTDPAPRYNARDSAVVLAQMCGAKTLLGSATPSIESYANASEGKYALVTLNERYGDAVMPRVLVSDTVRAVQRGERKVHFNKILIDKITAALAEGSQVMLFQNRRGFSPYVECPECGWVASCSQCNVTLTLHKGEGKLKCHYCGAQEPPPLLCPACGKAAPATRGFGTEKIEQELAAIFPQARIERLDRDTTQSATQYNSIIASFAAGETDVLVGTQIITKGFDFSGVSLVGILNADNLLNYPDFRASERAYQLMTQVAGRAGRRERMGEVVIQTAQPENNVIVQVARGDYAAMVRSELTQRHAFFYPPYCRLVSITLRHRDKALLYAAANALGDYARTIFGRRLLGPEAPAVDRIKGEYLVCFMLKVERTGSFARAKELLREAIDRLWAQERFRNVAVMCNVDPQ